MTAILGISAFYHDSAAATGRRRPHRRRRAGRTLHPQETRQPVSRAGDRVLPARRRGSDPEQLDYVGFYDKPFLKFERLLETYLAFAPAGFRSFLPGHAAVAAAETAPAARDPQGPGRPLPQALRLHRTSRIARRQRLLPLAVRGGGHPHRSTASANGPRPAWATAAATASTLTHEIRFPALARACSTRPSPISAASASTRASTN